MMKHICIVGNKGNMGRRYKSILDYIGIESQGFDLGDPWGDIDFSAFDGFIIASPTATHLDYIDTFSRFGVPILCEKPVVIGELPDIKRSDLISVVNQYAYLVDSSNSTRGDTYYNYYRSGPDGLAYDCVNIIGLARGKVTLENTSPIWKCTLNGVDLNIADMDHAYIKMIMSWTKNPESNWDYARYAHKKVAEWLKS